MNIKEFIKYIITFDNVDNILNSYESQSEKGFVFERLFDVVIKFGFCDIFKNCVHLIGNSNNGKLKQLKNIDQYLNENVISGNSSGCSDITLLSENGTFIFISSKYFKTEKSIIDYDVQNIVAMATKNKHVYEKFKIYILVPNKKTFLNKVKNANESSTYITEHMNEKNILDKADLQKYFLKFKHDVLEHEPETWKYVYFNKKDKLTLRFHQELITSKTCDLIEEGNKSFGWFCKCRSGKTYMVAGIINKQLKIKNKLNVLIITPVPTETIPQFTDDLFDKFKDFDKFKIHNIKDSKMVKNIELCENNIFIMSKQLLQRYIDKQISQIKDLKLNMIIFDENHESGTTSLSKEILKSYSSKNTVKIYLTATYSKPLKEWSIPQECQMYWDIEDEQKCKLKNEDGITFLKEKHGEEYVQKTILHYENLGLSLNEIFEPYDKMPDLHLITNMFDQQRYEILKEKLNSENKMGFCFSSLFGLNQRKTRFSFENEVKIFLRYISGSFKEEDGEKTIFTRINYLCTEKETRLPFTQIWFLPPDNIEEISNCLKKLMIEDNILKQYEIMCINRKNKELPKDVKDEICKKEIESKNKGKRGVILLAGSMLSLGITLNLCDLVILLNNTLSSDRVLQQMYRCMSESENKKIGFVVDMNISRVLNTCLNYNVYKNSSNIDDKIKYLIKNHLINIDTDMLLNKKINSDVIIKKLLTLWKEDPINSFRTLLKKLDNDYEDFDNVTQKLINTSFSGYLKNGKGNLTIKLKDEDDELQDLPSGIEKIKEDEEILKEDKVEQELTISFTKDVLPYIIPLTCILTIKNSNMDFVKMLTDIKENPELLDVFNDQCLIWWNKKDLIDLIKEIVSKFFDKNSNTYNISIQFKMSLQSLIDKPKELLELIDDCLKPKDIEKKKFGEVFTPMNLINEMLDKLPVEVWRNKNLKWLDPATGMGNFPVAIYIRLMKGLENEILNREERKKHILENMLYMCELNKKNVLVCKQIFDVNNKYNLNLYQGDTLEFNSVETFNVNKFDIIVGNPPYNASGTKASGNTIWQLFVNESIKLLKKNGYLCFVHPNGWRKPNSEKGKLQGLFDKMTKDSTMLYLEIHDVKDGLKHFKCGTRYDWYVLCKSKNKHYKTKILDQNNVSYDIDLSKYNWLANCELDLIDKLIASEDEEKCKILQSMSAYEARKKWISKTKTKEFKYPVVHSTPKNGHRFVWSNINNRGFYGVKKVIFGDSGIYNPIIDITGKYGMTQHAMAIEFENIKEGKKLAKILSSPIFDKILKACLWSSFAIDWNMFKDFKKDFYKILRTEEILSNLDEQIRLVLIKSI